MTKDKRRVRLLRLVRNNPSITNKELAKLLYVSSETIRNDIRLLEKEGILCRGRDRSEIRDNGKSQYSLLATFSTEERRKKIIGMLEDRGELRTQSLARLFHVAESTIRNDLAALQRAGSLERRHGKAILTHNLRLGALLSLFCPDGFSETVKNISQRVLETIEDNDCVFLDESDYSLYLSVVVPSERGIRIVTNSLRSAIVLAQRNYRPEMIVLPGVLNLDTVSTKISVSRNILGDLFINRAFFEVSAYHQELGFFSESSAGSEILREVADVSEHLYLLLSSNNVDKTGPYRLPVDQFRSKLRETITDDRLPEETVMKYFNKDLPVTISGAQYRMRIPIARKFKIGFTTLSDQYEFSETVRRSIEYAVQEYSSTELVLMHNDGNPKTTLQNVTELITMGVDLVIEYQQDFELSPVISDRLANANIPVVAIDIPIPGAVLFGANNMEAGRIAGNRLAQEVERRWGGVIHNLILVTDSASGPNSENRIISTCENLFQRVPFDESKVLKVDVLMNPKEAEIELGDLLQRIDGEKHTVVITITSTTAAIVLRLLKEHGLERNSIVAGHALTGRTKNELHRKDSPLIGYVEYFPERYGARIVNLAMKILQNEPVERLNFTQHAWVSRPS